MSRVHRRNFYNIYPIQAPGIYSSCLYAPLRNIHIIDYVQLCNGSNVILRTSNLFVKYSKLVDLLDIHIVDPALVISRQSTQILWSVTRQERLYLSDTLALRRSNRSDKNLKRLDKHRKYTAIQPMHMFDKHRSRLEIVRTGMGQVLDG